MFRWAIIGTLGGCHPFLVQLFQNGIQPFFRNIRSTLLNHIGVPFGKISTLPAPVLQDHIPAFLDRNVFQVDLSRIQFTEAFIVDCILPAVLCGTDGEILSMGKLLGSLALQHFRLGADFTAALLQYLGKLTDMIGFVVALRRRQFHQMAHQLTI